jgi:hypothetical protein
VIDQVRGPIGHAAPTATRTESSPLTGERDQSVETAIRTAEPRESRRQASARQEVAKFLLDETRQALAAAPVRRLGAEGLEVVARQLTQGALLGPARLIGG